MAWWVATFPIPGAICGCSLNWLSAHGCVIRHNFIHDVIGRSGKAGKWLSPCDIVQEYFAESTEAFFGRNDFPRHRRNVFASFQRLSVGEFVRVCPETWRDS